jgi:hypothetical protein
MSDAGISAKDQPGSSNQCRQLTKIKLASQHAALVEAGKLSDLQATRPFCRRSGDHYLVAVNGQASGYLRKAVQRPAPGLCRCTWMDDHRVRNDRALSRFRQLESRWVSCDSF